MRQDIVLQKMRAERGLGDWAGDRVSLRMRNLNDRAATGIRFATSRQMLRLLMAVKATKPFG